MVYKLYAQKLTLYREMEGLSGKLGQFSLAELGKEGQVLELERLMKKRAALMAKIDILDEKIQKEKSGKPGQEADQRLTPLRRSLQSTGQRIEKSNRHLERVLQEGLAHLRLETKRLREGKQSSRAYFGRADAGEGLFVDKRIE